MRGKPKKPTNPIDDLSVHQLAAVAIMMTRGVLFRGEARPGTINALKRSRFLLEVPAGYRPTISLGL